MPEPTESPFDIPDYVRAEIAATRASAAGLIQGAGMRDGRQLRKAGIAAPGSFYGHTAESLDHVPRAARFLDVRGTADLSAIAEMPLEYLRIWSPSQKNLPVLRRLKSLRYLYLTAESQAAVDAFQGGEMIEHVILSDCRKVESIRAITELPRLVTLIINDVRPLPRLDEIGAAKNLRALGLAGAMWTAMRVPTLEPIESLSHLEILALSNVRVGDESLAAVARLRALQKLQLPNLFRLEEFAHVAAALPNVSVHWRDGFFGLDSPENPKGAPCKTCQTPTVTTLGKPTKHLCPACDRDKIEKHRTRWRSLVDAARPR